MSCAVVSYLCVFVSYVAYRKESLVHKIFENNYITKFSFKYISVVVDFSINHLALVFNFIGY